MNIFLIETVNLDFRFYLKNLSFIIFTVLFCGAGHGTWQSTPLPLSYTPVFPLLLVTAIFHEVNKDKYHLLSFPKAINLSEKVK
jgi:hypothetical protein